MSAWQGISIPRTGTVIRKVIYLNILGQQFDLSDLHRQYDKILLLTGNFVVSLSGEISVSNASPPPVVYYFYSLAIHCFLSNLINYANYRSYSSLAFFRSS